MGKAITPRLRPSIPAVSKVPLTSFTQQFNVPGMTPAQAEAQALLIRTGNGGIAPGSCAPTK